MNVLKGSAFLVVPLIAALFVQNAVAVSVRVNEVKFFDFDDAPYMGGAADIEAYMEDVYGSDITVSGGLVGDGIFPGPLHDYPGDLYIQAGPDWGTYWFSFSFEDHPITSVSFDWGVRLDAFHAYADGVEIFSSPGWDCWTWGNSGIISFDSPVTTLKFSDSYLGEIEVDDLIVTTAVPEPATISLLGLAAAVLALLRKRAP